MTSDSVPSYNQVAVSINEQSWKEVVSFENCGSDADVFTLDPNTGRVSFGDGIHGRKPLIGSKIETTYRTGDGSTGNVLSFAWTATDPNLHRALIAIITTSPNSFRLSLYQGMENSWRWRFLTWLCDVLKVGLLDSVFSKK